MFLAERIQMYGENITNFNQNRLTTAVHQGIVQSTIFLFQLAIQFLNQTHANVSECKVSFAYVIYERVVLLSLFRESLQFCDTCTVNAQKQL